MKNVRDVFDRYFSGGDLFGKLFNISALTSGAFYKFICEDNFTYDNDVFNHALSSFVKKYDPDGSFYITTGEPEKFNFLVANGFDEAYLNTVVEEKIIVAKFQASYVFDKSDNWCIFFDNDLDCFILWCDKKLQDHLPDTILKPNESYYEEKKDALFLEKIIDRMSYRNEFNTEYAKQVILADNRELFAL